VPSLLPLKVAEYLPAFRALPINICRQPYSSRNDKQLYFLESESGAVVSSVSELPFNPSFSSTTLFPIALVLIGFSRLILGYHFLGDVIGGIALGIPFLLLFLWMSALIYEKGWADRLSMPFLLAFAIVIPVLLTTVLPGADPPKILGYMAGASFGYIIEREKVRSSVNAPLFRQLIKVLVGVAVLFSIIVGLGGLLPSAVTSLGFIRYAMGGIWVTLFAPMLFIYLKLSQKAAS